jgi:hypothetical protein
MAQPHIDPLDMLGFGGEGHGEHRQLFDGGGRLHPGLDGPLPHTETVGLHAGDDLQPVDHDGLRRIRHRRMRRLRDRSGEKDEAQKRDRGQEESHRVCLCFTAERHHAAITIS